MTLYMSLNCLKTWRSQKDYKLKLNTLRIKNQKLFSWAYSCKTEHAYWKCIRASSLCDLDRPQLTRANEVIPRTYMCTLSINFIFKCHHIKEKFDQTTENRTLTEVSFGDWACFVFAGLSCCEMWKKKAISFKLILRYVSWPLQRAHYRMLDQKLLPVRCLFSYHASV